MVVRDYNSLHWENDPSVDTSLSADNLNHMDDGIKENRELIKSLNDVLQGLSPDQIRILLQVAVQEVQRSLEQIVLCQNGIPLEPYNKIWIDADATEVELLTAEDLNSALGGIVRFGVDENGNYGYVKAGETTVTPFNQ